MKNELPRSSTNVVGIKPQGLIGNCNASQLSGKRFYILIRLYRDSTRYNKGRT